MLALPLEVQRAEANPDLAGSSAQGSGARYQGAPKPSAQTAEQGAPAAAVIPSSSGYRFQVTSRFLSPVFRKEGSHSREGPREPPPESGTGRHQVLEIGLGAV